MSKEAKPFWLRNRFVGIYFVACIALLPIGSILEYPGFPWLDARLAPWPLWVSVLVGWLPAGLLGLTFCTAGALYTLGDPATRYRRARIPAALASALGLVLVAELGMLTTRRGDKKTSLATINAMQDGLLAAVAPCFTWLLLVVGVAWLWHRIRGDKVGFRDLDLDKRYIVGGGTVAMLAGLAVAIASHQP